MAQNPQQTESLKQWGQVVARAWSDETYKQRLLSDPQAVLAEAGLSVPPTLQVQVHEATPTHLHLVLPPPPAGEKMSDDELDQVAGGVLGLDSLSGLLGLPGSGTKPTTTPTPSPTGLPTTVPAPTDPTKPAGSTYGIDIDIKTTGF